MKNKELPKWFGGQVYTYGNRVTNPFSGESYDLDNLELSMYDFIIGAQYTFEQFGYSNTKLVNDFRKGLTWFRKVNPKAYMVLLD